MVHTLTIMSTAATNAQAATTIGWLLWLLLIILALALIFGVWAMRQARTLTTPDFVTAQVDRDRREVNAWAEAGRRARPDQFDEGDGADEEPPSDDDEGPGDLGRKSPRNPPPDAPGSPPRGQA